MPKSKLTLTERFEKYIYYGLDGCWYWIGYINEKGYGTFNQDRAHRFSFKLHNPGVDISGFFICHQCDNPSCVNPHHLFLGTHKDNMLDMVTKKRSSRRYGDNSHKSKLSDTQVAIIRELHTAGASANSLSIIFNVDQNQINNIVSYRSRKISAQESLILKKPEAFLKVALRTIKT